MKHRINRIGTFHHFHFLKNHSFIGSDQPRVTTPVQDRRIRTIHLRNRFVPAQLFPAIFQCMVQRRLRERGIFASWTHVGMELTPVRRNNPRIWASVLSPDYTESMLRMLITIDNNILKNPVIHAKL